MTPVQAILSCLEKYATFSGRASRSEFWSFYLFAFAGTIVPHFFGFDTIGNLFWLATFIPFLAVAWRRMHDCGNSGALVLLPFAIQVASVYAYLFAQLLPAFNKMKALKVSPDTTLGELQAQQAAIAMNAELERQPMDGVLPAALIFAIGVIWMVYLLGRAPRDNKNPYGPNPNEVTP